MRRPQVGQSLRSFCASSPHQGQKRRFSTAHGSRDWRGRERQHLADDLQLVAGLAVAVDLARLGLDEVSRARWRGCAGGSAGCSPPPLYLRAQRASARPWLGLRRVRVLIFHGYLLGGTGSNVYNARLAEALVRLGHEVHLLCQERHPEEHAFVDADGDWDAGTLRVRELRRPTRAGGEPSRASGGCTVYRPDIGGLLPVYVADRYEGIEARTFADCSDEEIARYIDANVAAVREVAGLVRPQLALANHLVMGPVILARGLDGAVPYAVKVHGSALEYTVKPQPERFLRPRARACWARAAVLVGSRHTAESLWEALGGESWLAERTRLGPPGVDVERFAPREPAPRRAPAWSSSLRACAPARRRRGPSGRGQDRPRARSPATSARRLPRSSACVRSTTSSSRSWAS